MALDPPQIAMVHGVIKDWGLVEFENADDAEATRRYNASHYENQN